MRLPSRRVSSGGWLVPRRLSDRRNKKIDVTSLFGHSDHGKRGSGQESVDETKGIFPRIEEGSAKTIRSLSLSKDLEQSVLTIDVFAAVVFMRGGAYMLRYPRLKTRKPQSRLFKVDLDTLTLRWTTPGKSARRTQLELSKVVKIVPGVNSRFWKARSRRKARQLGIELLTKRNKVRLQTNDLNEWRHWIRGLSWALHKTQQRRIRSNLTNKGGLLSQKWNAIAKAEEIRLEDVLAICKALNLVADRRYIRLLFHKLDEDGSQLVDFGQFSELVQQVTVSPELMRYASAYINSHTELIDSNDFEAFLRDVQNEVPPEAERLVKIMDSLEGLWISDGCLTPAGFCHLMRQDWNGLQNPLKTAHMLTHDMTRPLHDYWIHACIDPFYSPEEGKSSKLKLAETLMSGVRSFPIAIVDGPSGVPCCQPDIVTSQRITIFDLLEIVKQYGFTTSLEPVIICLIIKCNDPAQLEKLASELENNLGPMLFKGQDVDALTKSPEELRKRVLLVARRPDPEIEKRSVNPGWLGDILTSDFIHTWSGNKNENGSILADFIRMPPLHPKYAALLSKYMGPLPLSGAGGADALGRCCALKASHLFHKGPRQRAANEVHAMNYWKLNAVIRETDMAKLLCETHSKSLGMAYPGGNQISRANVGVTTAINTGFQFVAISRQAGGVGRSIVESIFDENGCCGYVPKPLTLRSGTNQYDPEEAEFDQAITLSVTIVNGHQLPRGFVGDVLSRNDKEADRVKIVDWLNPFVAVSVRGIPADDSTYASPVVRHNGFHPLWPAAKTEFHISRPSLAFLIFEVWHEDGVGNQLVGRNCFRVSSIRSGLRWVALRDVDMKALPWAGLNVAVTMRAMQTKKPPTSRPPIPNAAERKIRRALS